MRQRLHLRVRWSVPAGPLAGWAVRGSILAAALVTASVVPTGLATSRAQAAAAVCDSEAPTEAAAEQMAARCAQAVEVSGARTELTQTFVESSGLRRLDMAVTPQRVRQGDGSWKPVSTTLVKRTDGTIAAEASTADITFSSGGSGPLVTWRSGTSTFTMSWPTPLPAPRLDGDSAVYDEVLPGTALHVTATADGFRHALEIKSAAAASNSLLKAIKYNLGGTASRRAGANGGIEVSDAAGAVFATGGGAAMWDSTIPAAAAAAKFTGPPAATSLMSAAATDFEDLVSTATEAGAAAVTALAAVTVSPTQMTVIPDAAMLAAPGTVYPVFVDPQLNGTRERWAWANSDDHNTDVENRARVGRNPSDGALYRSFFNFNISGIHDVKIIKADITMWLDHSYSCDPSWVWLYRTAGVTVDSGARMNWSTRPLPSYTLDSIALNANEAGGCGVIQADAEAVFDGTSIRDDLQYAVNPGQHWNNYVAALCACNSSGEYEDSQDRWKKFFTDRTVMHITYDRTPNAPTPTAFNPTTDCYKACTGAAVVRTSTPTLNATASDPDGGNLVTTFEVRATASDTGTLVATNASAPYTGSSGNNASWKVSASLADGGTYYWRARSKDETAVTGAWSGWQTLKIDKTAPTAPTISSAQYKFKQWGPTPGQPGTFTFAGATGAYEYTWSVDGGTTATTTATSATYTPVTDMVHTMRAYATDVAGNKSGIPVQNEYQFWVTPKPNRCWNWRLDETSGTTAADKGNTDASDPICAPIDATIQAQPGTLSAGTTWGAGHVGNAAVFAGSGQITAVGPVIDTAKSFTVMAWVKPSNLAAADEQVVLSDDGTTGSRFALKYSKQANSGAGGWCFALRDSDAAGSGPAIACATGTLEGNSSVTPANNAWVHLAGVYNAEVGKLQVHVMGNQDSCNGEMVEATPAGTPWAAKGPFVMGRGQVSGAATGFWRGTIDQVYVHQRVLRAAEICQQAVIE